MATPEEISAAISEDAESGIQSAETDGVRVTKYSLTERQEAAKHEAGNDAMAKPARGLRFTRLRTPGAG